MNGFETAALIRAARTSRHTPIIFLTAVNKTTNTSSRVTHLGAVDYLTKPFVPEVLRSKVTAFVELHKKTEEVKRQAKLLQQMSRTGQQQYEFKTQRRTAGRTRFRLHRSRYGRQHRCGSRHGSENRSRQPGIRENPWLFSGRTFGTFTLFVLRLGWSVGRARPGGKLLAAPKMEARA